MLFLSLTLSLKSPEDGMEWARLPQKQTQSTRHTLVPSPLVLVGCLMGKGVQQLRSQASDSLETVILDVTKTALLQPPSG